MRFVLIALPDDNSDYDDYDDVCEVATELSKGCQSSEEVIKTDVPPYTTLAEGDVNKFYEFTDQYDAT